MSTPPVRHPFALALACALVLAALVAGLPWLRLLDERVRDGLTSLVAVTAPAPQIAVVDIDEQALQRVGAWPWSRAQIADLVEVLLGPLGARAVALDMVLPDPADRAGDERLAALAEHGPVALSHVLDFVPRGTPIRAGQLAGGREADPRVAPASGYVANHAGLAGARCIGHIGMEPDRDGVLRRIHLEASVADRTYATLPLALLACAEPARAAAARAQVLAEGATWRVPFRRSLDSYAALPAAEVLHGSIDPALVRGRYVLIGSSAVGLSDYVASPLHPVTAGVMVHAQVMSELLEPPSAWPRRAGSALPLAVAGTLAGLALLALAWRFSPLAGSLAFVALAAGWTGLAAAGFRAGFGLPVLPPLAAFAGFSAGWLGLEFAQARRLSRRAMNTLSHYVAAPVLKLLVRQGLQRTLQPTRQQITVLVADMAGYTRLTAESSLEDSARLTTEFLEAITPPVLEGGGTLDRYTGDGLIAFWGAPLARADHAQAALDAAQAMFEAVRRLNVARVARGEPALSMRAGIESGEALVGDLGSSARSVYTAVGSCINLASRLQELARDIGETLVVGPQAQVQVHTALRPLGSHQPRGTALELQVYSLPVASELATPATPGTPGTPGAPGKPDTPATPATPAIPGIPAAAGTLHDAPAAQPPASAAAGRPGDTAPVRSASTPLP